MAKEPKNSPVNIDIGARAEAKFEVKAEIPASSAGRFVDAITDIFRPFSEGRGLRADQIRLQREDVLIEIAKKARARVEIENKPTKPIPNKFLVPYLEKGSLEDQHSELMQAWANLLVEAAQNFDPKLNVYTDILSKINGKDADFLSKICFASDFRNGVSWPTGHFATNEDVVRRGIPILDQSANLSFEENRTSTDGCGPFWQKFKQETQLQFGYLIHGVVLARAGALYFYNTDLTFVDGLMIDRLEAERLVRRTVIPFYGSGSKTSGSVSYLDLTYLAIDLVRICTRNFSGPIINA